MGDTRRTRPSEPTKEGAYELTGMDTASTGLHGSAPGVCWNLGRTRVGKEASAVPVLRESGQARDGWA